MAAVMNSSPTPHTPPGPDVPRPKGILKNSYRNSPPVSPVETHHEPVSHPTLSHSNSSADGHGVTLQDAKELTIANTQYNAGHRRSSSGAGSRPGGSRRQSLRAPSHHGGDDATDEQEGQRLKWDEANLYLTEQERSSTMKINEPKTPYAKHYDPTEDPSDDEMAEPIDPDSIDMDRVDGVPHQRRGAPAEDEIPGLSLGEPEEAVPENEFGDVAAPHRPRAVHVDSHGHDSDGEELAHLTPEEREKHRQFEEMRKRHYEMKNVASLLGHPEQLPDEEEDDDDEKAVPPLPNADLIQLRRPLQRVVAASCRSPSTTPGLGLLSECFAQLRIDANTAVHGRRYASVKSQGAYRLKPKRTIPKKLGAKKTGDQYVVPGNIIFKQRGTIWHPGENTIIGRDHTIHAAVTGYVKYYRDPQRHPKRQYIGVVFNKDDKLPYPIGAPRKRKLCMVAQPRVTEGPAEETVGPSGIPLTVTRVTEVEAPVKAKKEEPTTPVRSQTPVKMPKKTLSGGNAVIAALMAEKLKTRRAYNSKMATLRRQREAELRLRQNTRIFRLQSDYSYRETNWEIGRLVGDAGTIQGAEKRGSRKAVLRGRRRRRELEAKSIKMRKLARAARREVYQMHVKAKRTQRMAERVAQLEAAQAQKKAAAVAGEKVEV
ncbi:ribosomal L27 protein-domain-containing protein [Apodospora peruviana]|uniref:Large ribosomal subunit protein bL27m n=1 Tax=Apodospora peruviana TaxID=516989 RepID=A0AAE0IHF9_9PEZI|nr:ribosomal L27 protein-domain-containing protein [Apodospora peruviana]